MSIVEDLVALSRRLADPAEDLVILGEGNTSAALPDGGFLVKASGTPLGAARPGGFVRLDTAAVLAAIDDPALDDHDDAGLAARMREATVDPDAPRPSIEAMLHALALGTAGATWAGHTHPTAVNALLCSDRATEVVAGHLFPDQVVVCGPHPLYLPYAEPGLPLARAVRDGLRSHLDTHGAPPRLVYLGNHGIVALGDSADEVHRVTAMSVKAARVLRMALSAGRPAYLPADSVHRLDTRPDERHRRRVLAGRPEETP